MCEHRIIVVGAGIAGLIAGFRLRQAGHEVCVLEAADHVGGRMFTTQWGGWRLEPGAEFITSADYRLMELVDALGARDQLVSGWEAGPGLTVPVLRDGKLHTVNFLNPLSYLRWTAVSMRAKLGMLKLLPHMLKYRSADIYHPELALGPEERTFERFFYDEINREMFKYYIEPTFDVFCSYTANDLSEKMFLLLMMGYLNQKLYTFKEGIGYLCDQLAARLDIQTGAVVERIVTRPDGGGATITYRVREQEHIIDADAVVLAVPGDRALSLVEDPSDGWRSFYSQVHYSKVAVVYRIVNLDSAPGIPGVMLPRAEKVTCAALGFIRWREGQALTMSALKAHLYDPSISDEELIRITEAQWKEVFPEAVADIIDCMAYRWEHKVPTFRPGYLNALKAFKSQAGQGPIYPAGDYLAGPSTGAALASGWECADCVLEKMR